MKEILCTLGPASLNDKVITRLDNLGVNYFRINLSHTALADLPSVIQFIQARTHVPICLDTEGAQIRTGRFKQRQVSVAENVIIEVLAEEIIGDDRRFNLYPISVIQQLQVGDFVSIDFNSVLTQVIEKTDQRLKLRVLTAGIIGQNKAVSVDWDIDLPPLTDKDIEAIKIGLSCRIRHFALSFANHASDVRLFRSHVGQDAFVMSKIESQLGVQNLEAIVVETDALLIDRGDLSREVSIEQIPRIQMDIIRCAKQANKKVYVATNLLESMTTRQTPTRAEVNDVFSTLKDGADGLVLAAETAIGAYPINCVEMIAKMIRQWLDFSSGKSTQNSFLLTTPHGGRLVNRLCHHPDWEKINTYPTLPVDITTILDVEQIAVGTFSPLEGFMGKKDLESVLNNYCLANGVIWSLPILLSTKEKPIVAEGPVVLTFSGKPYALMHIEEVYTYDLHELALKMFDTTDGNHPGVSQLQQKGKYFIGGKIELLTRLSSAYKYFELTPRQARTVFENKGWSRVVGFHTRNVVHRAHEYIQLKAFEKYYCDGLFLHPVVGPKKSGDFSAKIILDSYQMMVEKYYPKGKALMAAFQSYSRYAGPREAVFTALCRKNFGCSHFIVGRDHTGVAGYYAPIAAQDLFRTLGDIGITPVFFNAIHYCQKCQSYVEQCSHGEENTLKISGSQVREMLRQDQLPPAWFSREEISDMILGHLKKGEEVFVP